MSRGLDQRLQTVVEQFTSGLSTVSRQRIDLLPIIYRRFIEDYWLSNDLLILFYALFYFLFFSFIIANDDRLNLNLRLSLVSSVSWVTVPDHFVLMNTTNTGL